MISKAIVCLGLPVGLTTVRHPNAGVLTDAMLIRIIFNSRIANNTLVSAYIDAEMKLYHRKMSIADPAHIIQIYNAYDYVNHVRIDGYRPYRTSKIIIIELHQSIIHNLKVTY